MSFKLDRISLIEDSFGYSFPWHVAANQLVQRDGEFAIVTICFREVQLITSLIERHTPQELSPSRLPILTQSEAEEVTAGGNPAHNHVGARADVHDPLSLSRKICRDELNHRIQRCPVLEFQNAATNRSPGSAKSIS